MYYISAIIIWYYTIQYYVGVVCSITQYYYTVLAIIIIVITYYNSFETVSAQLWTLTPPVRGWPEFKRNSKKEYDSLSLGDPGNKAQKSANFSWMWTIRRSVLMKKDREGHSRQMNGMNESSTSWVVMAYTEIWEKSGHLQRRMWGRSWG